MMKNYLFYYSHSTIRGSIVKKYYYINCDINMELNIVYNIVTVLILASIFE